jgi:aminopeptidase N
MKLSWKALVGVGVTVSGSGYAQIAPPTKHFAPDRDYHMIRAVTSYDIDETHQRASATVTLTFSMLRQGISNVRFDTSAEKVLSIEVDGKPINGANLGQVPIVGGPTGTVHTLKTKIEGTFFHWFKPSKDEPERSGFYTEGLSGSPVGWAYPNDRYATELHMTLPKAWSMYSNGLLMSDAPVGTNRHTIVWKMDEPHPNYLNSIVVGPFVEHKDTWHGMPLILTCPPSIADKLD